MRKRKKWFQKQSIVKVRWHPLTLKIHVKGRQTLALVSLGLFSSSGDLLLPFESKNDVPFGSFFSAIKANLFSVTDHSKLPNWPVKNKKIKKNYGYFIGFIFNYFFHQAMKSQTILTIHSSKYKNLKEDKCLASINLHMLHKLRMKKKKM